MSPRIPIKLAKSYDALATAHATLGSVTEIPALYILLAAGKGVLPEKFHITKCKAWMQTVLILWWFVLKLRPLVRPAFLSEMKSRGLRSEASS